MLRRWFEGASWKRIAGIVGLFAFGLYIPFIGNEFVSIDDGLLITKNPLVWGITPYTLYKIFTSYDPELYIPITFLSYQINFVFAGLEPWMYHLTNILLHSANAALVVWAVFLLSNKKAIAGLCGVLFAFHPLHSEAVLWAAARKDVLSAFFFLLSFGLFLLYRRHESRKSYIVSVISFLLALASKASVVPLPAILFLIDIIEGKSLRRSLYDQIPFILLAIVFAIIAVYGKQQNLASSGFVLNVLLGAKSTVFYLWKMIWPIGFSVIYPQATPVTFTSLEFGGSVIFVAVFVVIGILALFRSRWRLSGVGILMFLLLLVPNYTNFWKNGFLFFGSDRYAYLASIGIFLAIVNLLPRKIWEQTAMTAGIFIIPLLLIPLVFIQGKIWQKSENLYKNVIQLYPESALAHNNLGFHLREDGYKEEALPYFKKAIELRPDFILANLNMGGYYEERGEYAAALEWYKRAHEIVEKKDSLYLDEMAPYYYVGDLLGKMGNIEESLTYFQRAIEREPDYADAHYNLALKLEKYGRMEEAIQSYRKTTELDPRYIPAHYRVANLLAARGEIEEAAKHLRAVVEVDQYYEKAGEHLRNIEKMMRKK